MQRMNENRAMENKPLGDLFGDLAGEVSELVRKEVALAKLEIGQKAKHVGKNVGYLVVGGAVAYAAMPSRSRAIDFICRHSCHSRPAGLFDSTHKKMRCRSVQARSQGRDVGATRRRDRGRQ